MTGREPCELNCTCRHSTVHCGTTSTDEILVAQGDEVRIDGLTFYLTLVVFLLLVVRLLSDTRSYIVGRYRLTAMAFARQARSGVWTHFDRGVERHTCKLCKKTYSRQSGTSNLFAHLKSAHPSKFQLVHSSGATTESDVSNASSVAAEKRSSSSSLSSWVVNSATSTSRPCSSGRSEEPADLILDWIVDSTRPLSIAGDRGFVALMKFVEPAFPFPSRTHFSSLLRKRHEIGIADLKKLLENEGVCGIALTTDGWTSMATQSYVTYTAHFIPVAMQKTLLQ